MLYRQFALTIVASMVFSTVIALSLTPALDTLITLTKTTGVAQILRYNGVRSVNFDGNVSEGFSTGQALDALEEVVEQVASNTFQIEWSGQSRQEKLT